MPQVRSLHRPPVCLLSHHKKSLAQAAFCPSVVTVFQVREQPIQQARRLAMQCTTSFEAGCCLCVRTASLWEQHAKHEKPRLFGDLPRAHHLHHVRRPLGEQQQPAPPWRSRRTTLLTTRARRTTGMASRSRRSTSTTPPRGCVM